MKQMTLALFALLALALPRAALAQTISAKHAYAAKFLCGYTPGGDSALGVVRGHYNTILNVHAVQDRTMLAYRVTAMSTDLDTSTGAPSDFSQGYAFDTDGGVGLICGRIKSVLGVQGQEGFVEGFVTIYSDRPLDVVDVLTGQQEDTDVSVLRVFQVHGSRVSMKVTPALIN